MKFKFYLLSFNIVIILTFIMLFFVPAFFIGFSYINEFLLKNWYLAILFLFMIIVINFLYFLKKDELKYLEDENWNALIVSLENKIAKSKKVKYRTLRLLIDTLVLTSEIQKIKRIEEYVFINNKKDYQKFSLQFASAALLFSDESFFYHVDERLNLLNLQKPDWFAFIEGFLLQTQKNYRKSYEIIMALAEQTDDFILSGLSSLLLATIFSKKLPTKKTLCLEVAENTKTTIKTKISKRKWKKQVEYNQSLMHISIFTKLINETENWIFD